MHIAQQRAPAGKGAEASPEQVESQAQPDVLHEDAAETLEKVEVMLMARKLKLEMVFAGIEAETRAKIGGELQPLDTDSANSAAKAFRRMKRRYAVREKQLAALKTEVMEAKVTPEALSSEELYDLYADVLHFPTGIETEVDWLPRSSTRNDGHMVAAEFSSEVLELSDGEVQAHANVTTEKDAERDEHLFGLEYRGQEAQKKTWVQFFWREIVYGYNTGGEAVVESPPQHIELPLKTGVDGLGHELTPAPGGDFESFGHPTQQHWELDFTSFASPSYEERGMARFNADSITVLDSPEVQSELLAGLVETRPHSHQQPRIMQRWHAESYLMGLDTTSGLVLPEARVKVDIVWDPTKGGQPVVKVSSPKAVNKLPGVLRGVMSEENESMAGALQLSHGAVIK